MSRTQTTTTLSPAWRWPARMGWLLIAAGSLTIFALGSRLLLTTPPPSCIAPANPCAPGTISLEDIRILSQMGITNSYFWLIYSPSVAPLTSVTGFLLFVKYLWAVSPFSFR